MMARRIQRRRVKGWRMPPGAVYVGRPTKWGNPYRVGPDGSADVVVSRYRLALTLAVDRIARGWRGGVDEPWRWMVAHLDELRGRDLVCWCPLDRPCHADVLLEMANAKDSGQ